MAIGKLTEYGANERDMKFSIAGSPLADFDCEIPLFGGGRVTSVCVYSGRFDKKPRGGIQDVSLALALEGEWVWIMKMVSIEVASQLLRSFK